MDTRSVFQVAVAMEMAESRQQHGDLHSLHEGYGVLLEEVEEFWEMVKLKACKRDEEEMRRELVQIAAMAQKIAEDCL